MAKLTESIVPDCWGRNWHVYQREDGSITVYYTQGGTGTHYVVYDTLDKPATDLLATLKELVLTADPETNLSVIPLLEALSRARAAIAKAEAADG